MSQQIGMWTYPPIGKVAVMNSGLRVMVWAHEGENVDCFTGCATNKRITGGNSSTMWRIDRIQAIDEPSKHETSFS